MRSQQIPLLDFSHCLCVLLALLLFYYSVVRQTDSNPELRVNSDRPLGEQVAGGASQGRDGRHWSSKSRLAGTQYTQADTLPPPPALCCCLILEVVCRKSNEVGEVEATRSRGELAVQWLIVISQRLALTSFHTSLSPLPFPRFPFPAK